MTQESKGQAPTFPESEGEGTDGRGSPGMVEEKSRPAEAGETGTTRFGMEDDDSEGTGARQGGSKVETDA